MAPLLYDIKNPLCPTNYAGAVWIEYSTTLGIGNWTLLEKLDPVSRRQDKFFKVQYPIPAGSQYNRTRSAPPRSPFPILPPLPSSFLLLFCTQHHKMYPLTNYPLSISWAVGSSINLPMISLLTHIIPFHLAIYCTTFTPFCYIHTDFIHTNTTAFTNTTLPTPLLPTPPINTSFYCHRCYQHLVTNRFRFKQPFFADIGDAWALDDVKVFRYFPSDWQQTPLWKQSLTAAWDELQQLSCCFDTEWCQTRLTGNPPVHASNNISPLTN